MAVRRADSIRRKLIRIIVEITVILLLCGFSILLLRDILEFRQQLAANTGLIARVIGDYSISDMAFGDRTESVRTLSKLKNYPELLGACIFDAQGELFSEFVPNPQDATGCALSTPIGLHHQAFHLFHVIADDHEEYGTLYLRVSTRSLNAKIRNTILVLLGLSAMLVFLAWFLAARLQRQVSEPIVRLSDAVQLISASHDYSVRVAKPAEDEIGTLYDEFNGLLIQIQKREKERDEADQRTLEKSTFLANMSHELRTPLNSIIGFSEILGSRLDDKIDDRERKFLHNINSSGQHLLGIVNDILDLSKVEAGHMELVLERVQPRTLVESVATLMRGVTAKRHIRLALELDSALPEVKADPVKFKQVLYNILANAVKFSPDHSIVTVRASMLPSAASPLHVDTISIAIEDQGIGIDAKHHELIFKPFKQVDSSSSRQFQGTGLGLSLVHKFVELHGGDITVKSMLGQGSTFTVLLPVDGPTAPAPAAGEAIT